jgi:hypothetical protein
MAGEVDWVACSPSTLRAGGGAGLGAGAGAGLSDPPPQPLIAASAGTPKLAQAPKRAIKFLLLILSP